MNHLAGQPIIDALRSAGHEKEAKAFEECKEVHTRRAGSDPCQKARPSPASADVWA